MLALYFAVLLSTQRSKSNTTFILERFILLAVIKYKRLQDLISLKLFPPVTMLVSKLNLLSLQRFPKTKTIFSDGVWSVPFPVPQGGCRDALPQEAGGTIIHFLMSKRTQGET